MLAELIELWPRGPSIPLGDYLVGFDHLFSLLIVALALGALRWPGRAWLVAGTLALALVALAAFVLPLARPYGVVEGSPELEDVGHVMVATAGGSGSDGRLVAVDSPHPLWGRMLAVISGFDEERLWRLYPWVPAIALLALGGAVAFSLGGLEARNGLPEGTLVGLGVYFALFLSAHRLSFMAGGSTFWNAAFWSAPHVGLSLAALCLGMRGLGHGAPAARLGGAVAVAVAGWLEPHVGSLFAVGAVAWALAVRSRGGLAAIAGALVLYLPFRGGWRATDLAGAGPWHEVVDRVFSVTVDSGAVFLLAVAGTAMLWQTKRPRERLLATTTTVGLVAWVLVSSSSLVARLLDADVVSAYVRLWLAVSASYGLYRALAALGERYPRMPGEPGRLPEILRRQSWARLGVAAFVLLSLPWCYPYWWMPVRMDPTWVRSTRPISGNLVEMSRAIRRQTEPTAVFVAGPSYAPWIPALSGRRVLLAGDEPADVAARRAAQEAFAHSMDARAIRRAATRYRLTHLAWGRLDPPALDLESFESSPLFERRFRLRRWVSIFEYVGPTE